MNIIVKDLPRTLTEKQLLQLFLPFGEVSAHNLVKEPGTGKSKGFGFVEMPDNLQAREAIKALHNKLIEDTRIRVKMISRKYDPSLKKGERPKKDFTGRRSFGAIIRTEEAISQRPERGRKRSPATRQHPASGPGRTRSGTEAGGGKRTSDYSGRGPTSSARSEGSYRARPARSGSDETKKPVRGRRPAAPQRQEGDYRSRFERTEPQGADRPFRSGRTERIAARDSNMPARPAGKYRSGGPKKRTEEIGGRAKGPRSAKRGRTPARPVKTGRSGARQHRSAQREKR